MSSENLNIFIWIIDTINAHGRITRAELSDLWQRAPHSDGNPIPHRTFFAYRREIERIFGIGIQCDNAYRYYIEKPEGEGSEAFRNWMLDSYALRHAMTDARDISDRIVVEKVPSAREHLSTFINAVRENKKVSFTYKGYTRPLPQDGIILSPYFLRLFKQRWYVIGARKDGSVRTYALDRISNLIISTDSFSTDEVPNPEEFFGDIYGITYSHADAQKVKLRVLPYYANYLRALPLHNSQKEEIFSDCSIFSYTLKLTPDLVREIVNMGPQVTVLEPRPLILMVTDQLRATLANYD
ncbi:MAG: WYL domain-containing protein [Prevotella sp.]|nr:WYL domain-containing protein [Prevotella sp.]MCM1074617.1 WYL domain-containing protein [Ruminococcus sp.]